jgi:CHAD domain-containing protein
MPPRPADSKNSPPEALERFLKRVLREHSALRDSLAPDPVHDLRVALRRCRTLAEGFATIDNHRDWKRMRKTAKRLQSGLAGLRDAQVMAERVRQLRIAGSPAGLAVAERLRRDERKGKRKARRSLEEFPRKRWKRWGGRLPKRAQRLQTSPATFAALVLDSIKEVAVKERRWRSGESQVAAHKLRIAVKQFRYTLQSFLPKQYAAWAKDLKRMQDTLGEMHDLDVLHTWLLKVAEEESLDPAIVRQWLRRIAASRQNCVERYKKAVSRKSLKPEQRVPLLWDVWRREIERLAES